MTILQTVKIAAEAMVYILLLSFLFLKQNVARF